MLCVTPRHSPLHCTLFAFAIFLIPSLACSQPAPAAGKQPAGSQAPAAPPSPELQKLLKQFTAAQKLQETRKYPEALAAYEDIVRNAILDKAPESLLLAAYSNMAVLYQSTGDNKNCTEMLHKVVGLNPKDSRAYAQLALLANMEHRYDEALECANKALANKPATAVASSAHFVKGDVAVARRDFITGGKEFEQAAKLVPTNSRAHFNYGLSLSEQGRFNESLKQIEVAKRLDPHIPHIDEYITKLKTYMAAQKSRPVTTPAPPTKFDAILQKDPHNGPALLGKARQLDAMHRLNEAESAYLEAISVMPLSYDANYYLAHMYEMARNYGGAKDHYRRAEQLAQAEKSIGNRAQALRGLASAELSEGLNVGAARDRTQAFAVAETHIKEALDLKPTSGEYKAILGRVYEAQARFKDAAGVYREMLVSQPDSVPIYVRLSNTYKAVRDIPGYVKVWKEYQARKPDDPTSYEYITETYNQTGDYQQAVNTLREMLKRSLTNSVIGTATVVLGQDLSLIKKPDDAKSSLKSVLTLAPSKVPAQFARAEASALEKAQRDALKALADLAAKEDKLDEAIGYLSELKKREADVYLASRLPPDGEVYKDIAALYERARQPENAIAEYQAMAKALPNDPTPHQELGRIYESQKKIDAAAAEYRRAAQQNYQDPTQDELKITDMFERNDMLDRAVAELERMYDKYPNKTEVLTALALVYRRTKQDEKALQLYDKIIKTNPAQGWVQDARAECLLNLHRYAEAERVFVEEIDRNPQASRQTYADLERTYGIEGKSDKYIDFVKPRFEKKPWLAVLMAVVYDEFDRLKREKDGQTYILGVIQKAGNERKTCLQMYANLLRTHKHNEAAIEVFRNIAAENPKDISAWIALGDELDFNGRQDEANKIYVALLARPELTKEEHYNLQYKIAMRYTQQSKFPQARVEFQKIFDANNLNFDAALRVGDLIEKTGTSDEAVAFYKKLLDIPFNFVQARADVRDRLGSLYEKADKKADAITQYQDALRLSPEDRTAQSRLKVLLPSSGAAQ